MTVETMEKMNHIGEAIRYVRHTLRLKIELVAQEAGCAPSNLSRIENGRQKPSIALLESLARAMRTSVSELYRLLEEGVGLPSSPSSRPESLTVREWLSIRQRIDALSAERRRQVLVTLAHQFEDQQRHYYRAAGAHSTPPPALSPLTASRQLA